MIPIEFPTESLNVTQDTNAASDPACVQWRASDKQSSTDGKLAGQLTDSGKPEWPGTSISRNPENSAASSTSSRPIPSPSSSIGSYSSEKSTLNPNAKVLCAMYLDYYVIHLELAFFTVSLYY